MKKWRSSPTKRRINLVVAMEGRHKVISNQRGSNRGNNTTINSLRILDDRMVSVSIAARKDTMLEIVGLKKRLFKVMQQQLAIATKMN